MSLLAVLIEIFDRKMNNIQFKNIASAFVIILAIAIQGTAQIIDPPYFQYKTDTWVTNQLKNLTLDEKIAQLMTIAVYPELGETSKNQSLEIIGKYKPGGILVMKGNPVVSATWINDFQKASTTPLLVAIDGEWGLPMRIDSTIRYPYAQALGAVTDSVLIYQMGGDIAQQMKLMGIHVNFSPVADISTNPENPVINFRSFGENKNTVAQTAWYIAKGMQNEGVLPVAKHFPGHGDTETDSHHTLPLLNHSKTHIDMLESYPFRILAHNGIGGIMMAHLNVPALDKSGTPSSLSEKIVTRYLRNEIGYRGLVVTDAINMKGVRTAGGNAELRALTAGVDMVECVPDLKKAIESVKTAITEGKISIDEINEKCTTVLAIKRWVQLNEYKPAVTNNLTAALNNINFEVTNRKLLKKTLTVLRNKDLLPLQGLDTFKIATLSIGGNEVSTFQEYVGKYAKADHFVLPKNAPEQTWADLLEKLENFNLVIAGIQGIGIYPANQYGTTEIQRKAVDDLVKNKQVIFAFFGNAYALQHFANIHRASGLITSYQNTEITQQLAAQLIFGAFSSHGKLSVTVGSRFRQNEGIEIMANQTLAYTIPEEVGINSELLNHKIDSIVNLGLLEKAYPGCQVIVAKNGNVIFQKSYGWHTYDKRLKVTDSDLYDWASVTKVTGPLPALMQLVDEAKLDVEKPLSDYWPSFKNSNKEGIKIKEFLAHQSGIPAWLPLWQMATGKKDKLRTTNFRSEPTDSFKIRVYENLYLRNGFKKIFFDTIRNSKLGEKKYLYSDLSFHIYPEVISNLTGTNYEDFVQKNFYQPLGATTVTYNPLRFFPLTQIVPTETDTVFRHANIHGFVHDEGAAMLGGVSGNAGLFGCANDLAKIFQMYLQKGFYGGKRYITEDTFNRFNKVQFPENNNRRALGFDKPLPENKSKTPENSYPARGASAASFGHTGFTGNMVWADPDNGLLYIFLSNRVYPTRENNKISELNIRVAIHNEIYNCIEKGR